MTTLSKRESLAIDDQVRKHFARSAAFQRLAPHEKASLLSDTSRVVREMAKARGAAVDPYAHGLALPPSVLYDPNAGASPADPAPPPIQSAPVGQIVGDASKLTDQTGGKFGDAIALGVTQSAAMVREIDFPSFVASLIKGTFHAIVTSSIEQMKAYAELVKAVSASLNDFKDQNTTDNQARDYLVDRYPRHLQISVVNGQPKVIPREDVSDGDTPDFGKDLGLGESMTDIDEESIEEKLVPAARDQLALGRQSLLATTILMGINRIVVTDGKINAKLKFTFSAKENKKMSAQAYDYANMGTIYAKSGDSQSQDTATQPTTADDGTWDLSGGSSYAKGTYQTNIQPDVRVTSEVDTSNTANITAAGQIMGEVSVNFKSETFPLEKMIDSNQFMKLQQAQGAGRGAPPAASAIASSAPTPAAAPVVPAAPPAVAPPPAAAAPAPAPAR